MIPAWNSSAVLPPVRPGQPGHSPDRSPYSASLSEVVQRFATSPERIVILRGLLAYRNELTRVGITDGFQWLDGSFMEHKELLLNQPPNDVDVVTFFNLPAGITNQQTFVAQNPDLFYTDQSKRRFHVDAYAMLIGSALEISDVQQISYWYSMWSHRRNGLWKGFVRVDISTDQDQIAGAVLDQIEREQQSL
jgi:hypothetical protein